MEKGKIFSIETMGLVDGPGIRVVVFMQGCLLRCVFCHNPESHPLEGGELVLPQDIIKKINRFKPYFERSGGGVTFSGGEPLVQPQFLLECLKLCRENGIHTCIDTAGYGDERYFEQILNFTDLVLYDVKACTKSDYKSVCGGNIEITEKFQQAMRKTKTPCVVRQVVVPNINDTDEYMAGLKEYIRTNIPFATRVELLPFHKMGEHKYAECKTQYTLYCTEAMDQKKLKYFQEKYF